MFARSKYLATALGLLIGICLSELSPEQAAAVDTGGFSTGSEAISVLEPPSSLPVGNLFESRAGTSITRAALNSDRMAAEPDFYDPILRTSDGDVLLHTNQTATFPEPSVILLLSVGAAWILRRGRRR